MTLTVLADELSIHRLPSSAAIPEEVSAAKPVFIARTAGELSVVCPAGIDLNAERSSSRWRALEVAGPLDFSLVGILASLTEVLAAAGVSVFSVSTFDTDYLLVLEDQLETARRSLRAAGHEVVENSENDD